MIYVYYMYTILYVYYIYIYSDVSNVRRVETEDCRILEANHISKFPQIQSQWIGLENPQETIDFMSFFMALSCKKFP